MLEMDESLFSELVTCFIFFIKVPIAIIGLLNLYIRGGIDDSSILLSSLGVSAFWKWLDRLDDASEMETWTFL